MFYKVFKKIYYGCFCKKKSNKDEQTTDTNIQKGQHREKTEALIIEKAPTLKGQKNPNTTNNRPQIPEKEIASLSLSKFKPLQTLGVGGFATVILIQHTFSKDQVFALKRVRKANIKPHQRKHIINEKNMLLSCDSPFIVKFYRTFKDNASIYFLIEPCLGGDLWTLLYRRKYQPLDETTAKFYIACAVEALEYLHLKRIVYRDLKPENLLIAHNGYAKLTDFGFGKRLEGEKTSSFVGTPEYMPPEIISKQLHDFSVDFWGLGILIFELTVFKTPFVKPSDPSYLKTYNAILKGIERVEFPSYLTPKCKNIILNLCKTTPNDRLGCRSINDIKGHPWFNGFHWNTLQNGTLKAPFLPKLKSKTDTRYFSKLKFKNDENKSSKNWNNDGSNWDADF